MSKYFINMKDLELYKEVLAGNNTKLKKVAQDAIEVDWKGKKERFTFEENEDLVVNCWGGFPSVYKKLAPLNLDKIFLFLFSAESNFRSKEDAEIAAQKEYDRADENYKKKFPNSKSILMKKEEMDSYSFYKISNLNNNEYHKNFLYVNRESTIGELCKDIEYQRGPQDILNRIKNFSEYSIKEYLDRFRHGDLEGGKSKVV